MTRTILEVLAISTGMAIAITGCDRVTWAPDREPPSTMRAPDAGMPSDDQDAGDGPEIGSERHSTQDAATARGSLCGNGAVDAGEQCDDGNMDDADNCRSDCTLACQSDADCDDGDVCTGFETCDLDRHQCLSAVVPLSCDDGSPCTLDLCHPISGCFHVLKDEDGDGHAADELGECGTDCDDKRADVHPGASERPGDRVDQDCDGRELCFLDADDDGYRADWTVIASQDADCDDPREAYGNEPGDDCAPLDPTIHPGAVDPPGDGIDQSCDGID